MKTLLSHERLLEVLSYDEQTGHFTWKVSLSSRGLVGEKAGRPLSKDYWRVTVDGVDYSAHRLAWFYVHGVWPANEVDHVNRIKNDNRISNLREATRGENHQNRSLYANNKSGVMGVYWATHKNRWVAAIRAKGKKIQLGVFVNKDDAAVAVVEAKKKLHPFSDPMQVFKKSA